MSSVLGEQDEGRDGDEAGKHLLTRTKVKHGVGVLYFVSKMPGLRTSPQAGQGTGEGEGDASTWSWRERLRSKKKTMELARAYNL